MRHIFYRAQTSTAGTQNLANTDSKGSYAEQLATL